MKGFGDCVYYASRRENGRFSIEDKDGDYGHDDLIKKFEGLIPTAPAPAEKKLARTVYRMLEKLDPACMNQHMKSIRIKLLENEVTSEKKKLYQ